MNYKPNSPVFCDNCAGFALANLDGQFLCSGCILNALLSTTDPMLFDKIVPLGSCTVKDDKKSKLANEKSISLVSKSDKRTFL